MKLRGIQLAEIVRPFKAAGLEGLAAAVVETLAIFGLGMHHGWWPLAGIIVIVAEIGLIRPGRSDKPKDILNLVWPKLPIIMTGLSATLIVALSPRIATQIVVSLLYGWGRVWWSAQKDEASKNVAALLVVTAVIMEAIFLMAAVWRTNEVIILILVWFGAYLPVYAVLTSRGERLAGVLAATWALVSVEISWVLIRWLFTYTLTGGYLLVPQPVVIMTALAYCFGSIYALQRRGHLSRARLSEYLLIGMILIAIVITGTPWRGGL